LLGILIVAGHNLLDYLPVGFDRPVNYLFATLVYQSGPLLFGNKVFIVFYPFLPWLGIMLLGYCLGNWYLKGFDPARRQRLILLTGLATTGMFILIRLINLYGDPSPWSTQKNALFTFLSFLNCTKYTVSLEYTLMTLGPMVVLLAIVERLPMHRIKPVEVFGRVPMFFYLIHFYLLRLTAITVYLVVHHKTFSDLNFLFFTGLVNGAPQFTGYFGGVPFSAGYSLFWVYVVWISVVLFLYPFCKKYNDYKSTHHQWWLSYL
jgi:uncharacterized membrane protein